MGGVLTSVACALLAQSPAPEAAPAASEKVAPEKVAVLDLTTPGIPEGEGRALSDNLVGIIAADIQAMGYAVLSSADLRAMLSFERQKALVGCEDDASCVAEIGGALGVDLLVSGEVGKLGDTYNLSLRLLNIQAAEAKGRFTGSAGSPEVLADTVRRGVRILFGKEQLKTGFGTILIQTVPSGATVFLDDEEVGISPVTADDVPSGDHQIRAVKGELSGKLPVYLAPEAVEKITVQLEASPPMKVKFLSDPPMAEVELNGDVVGTTPFVLDDVRAGEHEVRVEAPGHKVLRKRVSLSYAEYEAGGKAPLKIETKLESVVLLPIPMVLMVGPALNAMAAARGVSVLVEVGFELAEWTELTLGYSSPLTFLLSWRIWFYRGPIDVGAVIRPALAGRASADFLPTIGGGLVAGVGYDLGFAELGARVEVTGNVDLLVGVPSVPVILVGYWRM